MYKNVSGHRKKVKLSL